jgi:hypothetical protein
VEHLAARPAGDDEHGSVDDQSERRWHGEVGRVDRDGPLVRKQAVQKPTRQYVIGSPGSSDEKLNSLGYEHCSDPSIGPVVRARLVNVGPGRTVAEKEMKSVRTDVVVLLLSGGWLSCTVDLNDMRFPRPTARGCRRRRPAEDQKRIHGLGHGGFLVLKARTAARLGDAGAGESVPRIPGLASRKESPRRLGCPDFPGDDMA